MLAMGLARRWRIQHETPLIGPQAPCCAVGPRSDAVVVTDESCVAIRRSREPPRVAGIRQFSVDSLPRDSRATGRVEHHACECKPILADILPGRIASIHVTDIDAAILRHCATRKKRVGSRAG